MRKNLVTFSLLALMAAGVARAADEAEAIPADVIQTLIPIAAQIIEQQFPNPPVKVEPALDKTTGYHVKEMVGAVALPDKNMTAKAIEDAGDKSIPVGILATRSLSLELESKVVPEDKLAVADLNGVAKLPVFFLSTKGKGESLSLQVFGKDGTKPLTTLPLKKEAGNAENGLSIKLENIELEKKKLDVKINVGGAYTATLKMGVLEL